MFTNNDVYSFIIVLFCLNFITFLYFRLTKQTENNEKCWLFFFALNLKFLCLVVSNLIYIIQYKNGGDTFQYFKLISCIDEGWNIDFWNTFKFVTGFSDINDFCNKTCVVDKIDEHIYSTKNCFLVSQIGSVLSFVTNSFWGIGLFMTYFAFLGIWQIYALFCKINPDYVKFFSFTILFLPTILFFGGSGIVKEAAIFCFLGFLLQAMYQFIFQENKLRNGLLACILGVLVTIAKPFISICLYIACFMAWFVYYKNYKTLPNKQGRLVVYLVLGFFALVFILNIAAQINAKYSIATVFDTLTILKEKSRTESLSGSSYELSNINTVWDAILLFPQTIWVTLFRPYFWEIRKPMLILIPAALESLGVLLFTIYTLFNTSKNTLNQSLSNPYFVFCMTFSLLFAVIVGYMSGNFGTLFRYKVFLMPFYLGGLLWLGKQKN
jgi:hypothetical protein